MGASGAQAAAERYVGELIAEARRTGRPIAVDSSLVIEFFSGDPPLADLAALVLVRSYVPTVISTVSVVEATTRPARTGDDERVAAIHQSLRSMPGVAIVDLDQRHAIETAYVRAATGLKLPDAAIVATARLANASALIGNDRQWRNKPLGVLYHHMDDLLGLP